MEQHRFAVAYIQDFGLQAHGAARRNSKRKMRHGFVGHHVLHDAACRTHDLNRLARVVIGNVNGSFLDGLKLITGLIFLINNLRTTNLEFEAFTAHGFHENRKMKNATTGNANARLVFSFLNAHGDVALLFAHQTLLQLTSADDIALSTNQGTCGSLKHNSHGGFFNGQRLHLDRILGVGDNIADVGLLHADNSHNIACAGLRNLGFAKILKGIHLADLRVVAVAVGLDYQNLLFFVNGTALQAANANTSLVAAVVNRANLKGDRAVYVYIRAGDFLQNGIQQGNHVHVAVIDVVACVAINCRGINNREIKLLVACTQLNHQVEYLVDSSIGVSIGAVDLVDHNNDA